MADEAQNETGTGLMFIGLALWVVGLLVIFFLPAAVRLGHQRTFAGIIAIVGVLGLTLMMVGYSKRGRSSQE